MNTEMSTQAKTIQAERATRGKTYDMAYIGIFAVIFLFYTNSFLIKRRKKEFGLYNILGMEKRHLGRVVFWESVDTFLISMAAGVGFGVLFSELVYLCVERALEFEMSLKFEIVPRAIAEAAILFGIIFVTFYSSVSSGS